MALRGLEGAVGDQHPGEQHARLAVAGRALDQLVQGGARLPVVA